MLRRCRLLASLVVLPLPFQAQDLPSSPPDGTGARLHWGDLDGDGLADALAVTHDGRALLLLNRGDGGFDDATLAAGLERTRNVAFALLADLDRDERLDIFLGSRAGGSRLWRNLGGLRFEPSACGIDHRAPDEAAEVLDYDRDGLPDLALATRAGEILYRNVGRASFVRVPLPSSAAAEPVLAGAAVVVPGHGTGGAAGPEGARAAGGGSSARAGRTGGSRSASPGSLAGTNASSSSRVPPSSNVGPPSLICADTIVDQATTVCIEASSVGTLGKLYPLSDTFFVDSANGRVGVGTAIPSAPLHVVFGGTGDAVVLPGLRLEGTTGAPNLVGGAASNGTGAGSTGATIAGGEDNLAAAGWATVGGGEDNRVTAVKGTIAGGGGYWVDLLTYRGNRVHDSYGTVGGGGGNVVGIDDGNQDNQPFAVVAGGVGNLARGRASSVVGGESNEASGAHASVGGGAGNDATGSFSLVGGGWNNVASGSSSSIGGGSFNQANGGLAAVGGGTANSANGGSSTIGGGENNRAFDDHCTVAGGQSNVAGANDGNPTASRLATVCGGYSNVASGLFSAVGGGNGNSASGSTAVVGGGFGNQASGDASVIAGGDSNTSGGVFGTIGGGYENTVLANYATIPGGFQNSCTGQYSFAAGRRATASGTATFVWNDNSGTDLNETASNRVTMRAVNGFKLFTSATGGAILNGGSGSWSSFSDRNAKRDIEPIDVQDVLERVARLPLHEWSYVAEGDVRHVGPMAQDFRAAFGLGPSDTHIVAVDADGVALASIQALHRRLAEKEAEIAALREAQGEMRRELEALRDLVERAVGTGR